MSVSIPDEAASRPDDPKTSVSCDQNNYVVTMEVQRDFDDL